MSENAEKFLGIGNSLGVDFMDVRIQNIDKTVLKVNNDKLEVSSVGTEAGIAIRVIVNGALGFATVTSLNEDKVEPAIKAAYKMASASSKSKKVPVKLAEVKTYEDYVRPKLKIDPRNIEITDKIKLLNKANKLILEKDSKIKNSVFEYSDFYIYQIYMSTEGARVEQEKSYVWGKVVATAKSNSIFASARYEIGTTEGFSIWEKETPEKISEVMAKRLLNQLKAKTPKAGSFPAVLAPEVVGVFTHEAFGHLAEADLTLAGAVTFNKLGQQIASPLVSIYDDGTLENKFGSFKYDDEGVKAQKTLLVDKGRIISLMYDRYHSYLAKNIVKQLKLPEGSFNTEPTGNARSESFRFPPIIRMRNTYIAPGDMKKEELFEDIDFGYYLVSFRGGQANLNGTFQVGIQEGYEIVNGKIGKPIRNLSISGNTLETLLAVDGVANDLDFEVGRCGKGQTAFIGDGGPHIRVKKIIIGGRD